MTVHDIIVKLRSQRNPKNIAGMARFGINSKNTLGINMPFLRALAANIRKESNNDKDLHILASQLWKSGIHEARILAGLIDVPELVTQKQMDAWIKDFDSWDVCDTVCANLFDKTAFAYAKAIAWTKRDSEFEKRAGYVLMAVLAFHDKTVSHAKFSRFFPYIKAGANDERNFVKKSVNWALRQIGKRNPALKKQALKTAHEILYLNSKSAKWIAKDAIRELNRKTFAQG